MALSEALDGFDFNDLDAYVGVSAGSFIAAGLANGLSPAYLYRMFIDSDSAEVPFEPEMLLRPAIGEYRSAPRGSGVAARIPARLFAQSLAAGFPGIFPAAVAGDSDRRVQQRRDR
jgi:hypothetical protein